MTDIDDKIVNKAQAVRISLDTPLLYPNIFYMDGITKSEACFQDGLWHSPERKQIYGRASFIFNLVITM